MAAQLLAGDSEPHCRSAVSRAYYGAFHIGRDFVRKCGILIPAGPESHKNIRWCLANSGSQELDNAALQLESLRSARNKADYDLTDRIFANRSSITVHVQRAVSIATAIHAATAEEVAQKMRAYAQAINLPVSSQQT